MRLIDADALKEEIESLIIYVSGIRSGRKITDELLNEYRKSVIDRIEEQPTVSKWIPCSERLPKNEEEAEKQIPVKPQKVIRRMNGLSGECPVCKGKVLRMNYCQKCGQSLDWSDEYV